jgi:hypothetical protein
MCGGIKVGSRVAFTQSPTTHTNTFTTLLAEAGCSGVSWIWTAYAHSQQRYETGVSQARLSRRESARTQANSVCVCGTFQTNQLFVTPGELHLEIVIKPSVFKSKKTPKK